MTPKTHSPLLVNATDLHEAYLKGVVGLRDCVKVGVWHPVMVEYIWLELVLLSKNYWIGQVRSKTVMVEWIKQGDLLRFHVCNVYEIAHTAEVTV